MEKLERISHCMHEKCHNVKIVQSCCTPIIDSNILVRIWLRLKEELCVISGHSKKVVQLQINKMQKPLTHNAGLEIWCLLVVVTEAAGFL